MLTWFAPLMALAGALVATMAAYVGWRRGSHAGLGLAVLLAAVAWWGLAYSWELAAGSLTAKTHWGDLKYIGITLVAPSWLVYVLHYTNRGHLVGRWTLALLAVEPVVVLVALLVPATHDLVRYYPPGMQDQSVPVVSAGPIFWVHLVYSNVMVLVAVVVFVQTMVRLSGTYRSMALVLVGAALLPWVANLLYNFGVGWFTTMDLTPFAFVATGAVLVWGLYREGLVRLTPLARGLIVEKMSDAVFVLDAFGRVIDANPAAVALTRMTRPQMVGRPVTGILAGSSAEHDTSLSDPTHAPPTGSHLVLPSGSSDSRTYAAQHDELHDTSGRMAGQLLVLRDVTDRIRAEDELAHLLVERSRVATALQQSLVPRELPDVPGAEVAGRYEPAGDGHEIGGDFFDVFPLEGGGWGIVLGDVSGKGAEAAAVTALIRYTLRAFSGLGRAPSSTLKELNGALLSDTDLERHCTIVYAVLRPRDPGDDRLDLVVSLAGHHPPLVTRADGRVEPVGELGTALGLLEEVECFDTEVLLGPGDSICLFTDGLVEARQGLDLFGEGRVSEILQRMHDEPLGELATELVDAPRRFHGPQLADDLAVLLLRSDGHAVPRPSLPPPVRRFR